MFTFLEYDAPNLALGEDLACRSSQIGHRLGNDDPTEMAGQERLFKVLNRTLYIVQFAETRPPDAEVSVIDRFIALKGSAGGGLLAQSEGLPVTLDFSIYKGFGPYFPKYGSTFRWKLSVKFTHLADAS